MNDYLYVTQLKRCEFGFYKNYLYISLPRNQLCFSNVYYHWLAKLANKMKHNKREMFSCLQNNNYQ